VGVRGIGRFHVYVCNTCAQGELMEGENAWLCEEVGRRMAATKRTCIKHLPQTLAIHLKRFEYDHINMQRCVGTRAGHDREGTELTPYGTLCDSWTLPRL